MTSGEITQIICALIAAVGGLIVGLIGKERADRFLEKRKRKKISSRVWWGIHAAIISICLGIVVLVLLPLRWYILDSGNYHLGDNIFHMDRVERPRFQYPGGANKNCLILWDKSTGGFTCNNRYAILPNTGKWKDLRLADSSAYLCGAYYLGKVVMGYSCTFNIDDIKQNYSKRFKPKYLLIDFEVFHLSRGESGGTLEFVLNDNSFKCRIKGKGKSNTYNWAHIEQIPIPLNLLLANLNTLNLFVTPKYAYDDGVKHFHFEDVEIRNIRLKLK